MKKTFGLNNNANVGTLTSEDSPSNWVIMGSH